MHTIFCKKHLIVYLKDVNQSQYIWNSVTLLKYIAHCFTSKIIMQHKYFYCPFKQTINAAHKLQIKNSMINLSNMSVTGRFNYSPELECGQTAKKSIS